MALDTDRALSSLGKYGRWQMIKYTMVCLSVTVSGCWHMMVSVFTGGEPDHHCRVPNGTLLNETIPTEINLGKVRYSRCLQYTNYTQSNATEQCTDGWQYSTAEYQSTIVTEWDLVCSKNYLAETSQSVFNFGVMVGAVVFTSLADKIGRKPVHLGCQYAMLLVGFAIAFSPNYISFVVLRFLLGAIREGAGLVGIVMACELFPASQRTFAGAALELFWAGAWMVLALIAYLVTNWRHLQLVVTIPPVVTIALIWLLPESIPWLVANGKTEKAEKILQEAARFNGVTLPDDLYKVKTKHTVDNSIMETSDQQLDRLAKSVNLIHTSTNQTNDNHNNDLRGREKQASYEIQKCSEELSDLKSCEKSSDFISHDIADSVFSGDKTNANMGDNTGENMGNNVDGELSDNANDNTKNNTDKYMAYQRSDHEDVPVCNSTEEHMDDNTDEPTDTSTDDRVETDVDLRTMKPLLPDDNSHIMVVSRKRHEKLRDYCSLLCCKSNRNNVVQKEEDTIAQYTLLDIMKSRTMLLYTFIMCSVWFASGIIYFGLSLGTAIMPGGQYINFFLSGAVEAPAYGMTVVVLQKYGRRWPLFIFHMVAALVLFINVWLPEVTESGVNLIPLVITLSMIGKFAMTAAFGTVVLYAPEIYPTNLRNLGFGLASVWGRIGGMIAPFAVYVGKIYPWIPGLIFSIVAVVTGFGVFFLPETLNRPLPDTIEEIESWKRSGGHKTDRNDIRETSRKPSSELKKWFIRDKNISKSRSETIL